MAGQPEPVAVLGPLHAALIVFVVVATGNHWWLDGIVAVVILSACAWGVAGVRAAWRVLLARLRAGSLSDDVALEPVG